MPADKSALLTQHQNRLLSEWLIKNNFDRNETKARLRDDLIEQFKHINKHTNKAGTDWGAFGLDSLLDDCK